MKFSHPKEEEIQQYAISKTNGDPGVIRHIESCAQCLAEVETYTLLFTGIRQQSAPAFDFDLTEKVMSRLPKAGPALSPDALIGAFLVIFAGFGIGIPLYLFRKNISNLFMDMPPFFIYAIVVSTTLILVLKILFLYKKFREQMRFLNFN